MKQGFIALLGVIFILGLAMSTATPSEGQYEAPESPVSEFSIEEEVVTSPETKTRSLGDVGVITYYDVELDEDLQNHIFMVCAEYNISPKTIIAMIWRESRFNPNCIGDNGNSLGLMQIQPRYHSERMAKLGCTDLMDPYQNILVGVDYLAEMIAKDKGIEWALMAYNGGPTYANRKSNAGEVSAYAIAVLEKSESLETYEAILD